MASVNKVILVGNLGKDPEIRYSASGDAIANFSVATTSKWRDKASNEMREEVEWHRLTAFGKLAEIVELYLKKGSQVYIEGKLKTSKYTDKDGIEKYSTNIIADNMQMLGSRGESDQPSSAGPQSRPSQSQSKPAADLSDMDDDIPF